MHLLQLENKIDDYDTIKDKDKDNYSLSYKEYKNESIKVESHTSPVYTSVSAKSTPSKKSSADHYERKMPTSLLKPNEGIMQ
jgi:hypothetical protein